MLLEHEGESPKIDPSCRIAPNATICGDVTIGPNSSVGFGCVIVAESGPVTIGADCVVMDTAVVRGVKRDPVRIGDHVLIGPRAYLSGCSVGDSCFIATGAAIFNGAVIGDRSEVRVNAIVHLRSRLAPDSLVPLNWVAVGDPAEILPPEAHDEIWQIQDQLDFPGYVFGVRRAGPGESNMPDITPRYCRLLGRHRADKVLSE